MGIEESPYQRRSAEQVEGMSVCVCVCVCVWGTECGIQYRSDNPDRGAPVGVEERRKRGIECGMK